MIFIDTGAFIARYNKDDQYYQKATASWKKLAKKNSSIVTSNFIIDETLTLLARRTDYSFVAKRGQNIMTSEQLTILRPDANDEIQALELFEKYADQKVSFTDCISFALMKKNRISNVFGFDKHFVFAGFKLWS